MSFIPDPLSKVLDPPLNVEEQLWTLLTFISIGPHGEQLQRLPCCALQDDDDDDDDDASGGFVVRKQWKRWRAKRKLMSGFQLSSTRGRFCGDF